jgi:hypothetical protein
MKMKTMRRLKHTIAPRRIGRPGTAHSFDISDATMEPDSDPPPEAVFDRVTGPFGAPTGHRPAHGFDEET